VNWWTTTLVYVGVYLLIGLVVSRVLFRQHRKRGATWNDDDGVVLFLSLYVWPLAIVIFGLAMLYFFARKLVTFDQSQFWKVRWIPRRLKKIEQELQDPPV
jgi:hypothetical protein